MQNQHLKLTKIVLSSMFLLIILTLIACQSAATPSPSPSTDNSSGGDGGVEEAKTITVGVFQKADDGTFTNTGKTLVYDSQKECQTWSRSAQGDAINSETHLHYNAAKNVSYKDDTFTWTEFGPEHSQEDIDATCAAGKNGATKSVNSTEYHQDKSIYLKIIKVE